MRANAATSINAANTACSLTDADLFFTVLTVCMMVLKASVKVVGDKVFVWYTRRSTNLQSYVDANHDLDAKETSPLVIKSLDANNAFNSISLTSIYKGLQRCPPELIPWFLLTYGAPS